MADGYEKEAKSLRSLLSDIPGSNGDKSAGCESLILWCFVTEVYIDCDDSPYGMAFD